MQQLAARQIVFFAQVEINCFLRQLRPESAIAFARSVNPVATARQEFHPALAPTLRRRSIFRESSAAAHRCQNTATVCVSFVQFQQTGTMFAAHCRERFASRTASITEADEASKSSSRNNRATFVIQRISVCSEARATNANTSPAKKSPHHNRSHN